MVMNKNSPSQFELFPASSEKIPQIEKRNFSFNSITLSTDNIIIIFIGLILAGVLFYSYGVESGKNVVLATGEGQVEKKAVQKQKNDVLLHSADSSVTATSKNVESKQKPESDGIKVNEQIIEMPIPLDNQLVIDEGYTIQVASFKLEKNAKEEAGKIKDLGHESFVLPKGNYSIVCVGRFIERNKARAFSNRLKGKYNDCLVRRL